jgi:pre-mRNA-processing factor 19
MQEALLQTRKELAHALYQHDAACHVIARLQQENAEMRERLANQDQRIEELLSVQQP